MKGFDKTHFFNLMLNLIFWYFCIFHAFKKGFYSKCYYLYLKNNVYFNFFLKRYFFNTYFYGVNENDLNSR